MLGKRDNAKNNARCTQARKATHGLDGQHQDVDKTPRGRVNQNERGHRYFDNVSHKPGGRLPLLSARPAVTPATLKRAATTFAAW